MNRDLLQAKLTPTGRERDHICDFSRCRLNVRLTAHIQPLLRGHKYGFFLFQRAVFSWGRIAISHCRNLLEKSYFVLERLGDSVFQSYVKLSCILPQIFSLICRIGTNSLSLGASVLFSPPPTNQHSILEYPFHCTYEFPFDIPFRYNIDKR